MKRKLLVLSGVVVAALIAAPGPFRALVSRFSANNESAPEETADGELYTPGTVRHDVESATGENELLANTPAASGPIAEIASLPEVTEPPMAPTDPIPNALGESPAAADDAFPAPMPLPPVTGENSDEIAKSAEEISQFGQALAGLAGLAPMPEIPSQTEGELLATDEAAMPDLPPSPGQEFAQRGGDGGEAMASPPSPPTPETEFPAPAPENSSPAPKQGTEPLPSTDQTATADADSNGTNLVLFAREMLSLRVPDSWYVAEVAAGRDVRLVLSPTEYKDRLDHGLWISAHVTQGPRDRNSQDQLLSERVATVTQRDTTDLTTSSIGISSWGGVRGDFRFSTENGVNTPDWEQQDQSVEGRAARRRASQPREYQGVHMLVTTPWALIELHGVAPDNQANAMEVFEQIIETIQVKQPKALARTSTSITEDASSAFGVWKSSHGRMRIFADGRIDLETDKLLLLNTPASQQEAERLKQEGPPRLRGKYEAKGDLLLITWEDDSKLNLRWKRSKGKLLVTDHLGKTSKLKPLLE